MSVDVTNILKYLINIIFYKLCLLSGTYLWMYKISYYYLVYGDIHDWLGGHREWKLESGVSWSWDLKEHIRKR